MSITISHFNTWAATLYKSQRLDFYQYIQRNAKNCDIFHLYEVHSQTNPRAEEFVEPSDPGHRKGPIHVRQLQYIQHILRNSHDVYFKPQMKGLHDCDGSYPHIEYGIATCVRHNLKHIYQDGMVYRTFGKLNDGKPAARAIQSVIFEDSTGEQWQSVSFHGMWDERSKVDTQERFEQSHNALEFIQLHRETVRHGKTATLILGGDFNLTSDCRALDLLKSAKAFGENGGVILNHKYDVRNTRTNWYPEHKPYREANFVIVDPRVTVKSFDCDMFAPSDHACLTTVLNK